MYIFITVLRSSYIFVKALFVGFTQGGSFNLRQ